MSVILGLKTKDIVIIAGDKRICNINGKVISEQSEKVHIINNHLAYASGGNDAMGKFFLNSIEDAENLYVEDLIAIIQSSYKKNDRM